MTLVTPLVQWQTTCFLCLLGVLHGTVMFAFSTLPLVFPMSLTQA